MGPVISLAFIAYHTPLHQEQEPPYQGRVKGKHTKRNFGSSLGRTSLGEL
jgi:hypothetical protein